MWHGLNNSGHVFHSEARYFDHLQHSIFAIAIFTGWSRYILAFYDLQYITVQKNCKIVRMYGYQEMCSLDRVDISQLVVDNPNTWLSTLMTLSPPTYLSFIITIFGFVVLFSLL